MSADRRIWRGRRLPRADTYAVESTLTTRQSFEAMRRFVAQFADREPPQYRERFDQLLRWTRIESDGVTCDPAQWQDWEAVVATVLAEGE